MKKQIFIVIFSCLTFHFSLFTLHSSFAQQGTIQLPATGQTTSYYPGDDGDLQMGIPIPANRFTNHGNGSCTDALTGLMWATDANLIATRDPDFDQDRVIGDGDINWKTALDYITKLNTENYLGHNDWRMPNCMELRSLVNLGNDSITFPENHPFINLKEGYWSSTTYDRLRGSAISVYLSKLYVHVNLTYHVGTFGGAGKNLGTVITYLRLYLLPVRYGGANGNIEILKSGQTLSYYSGDDVDAGFGIPWPSPRLADNSDGSVTDRLTGLMWTKNTDLMYSRDPEFDTCGNLQGKVCWVTALGYINKLNNESYLGYNDWRLPNRNELTSLIDYSRHAPGIPKNHPFFTPWMYDTPAGYRYWSSSTLAYNPDQAWIFHFGLSILYNHEKTIECMVWPVRTDNSSLPAGSIHGYIDGEDIPKKGVEITLEGPVNARTETNVDGYYEFTGIPNGNYTLSPSYEYFAFTPLSKSVNVSGTAVSCDFTAAYKRAYGWVDISSNLFPYGSAPGSGLSDIYFINDDEGWITNSSHNEIYHTTDGGDTWEIQTTPLGATSAIHMLDADNGYAGGEGGWIYKTEDGGENWTIVGTMGNLIDLSFPFDTDPNDPVGYASGDDGRVWEINSSGLTDLNSPSSSTLRGISAPSVDNVWVCGGNRIYYYNGTDFTSQSTPGGTFNDIHFINNQEGWVVGDGGKIGGTADGGEEWLTLLQHNNEFSLYGVHSSNGKDVWVVGSEGTILHSPNRDDFHPKEPFGWEINTVWNREAAGLTNSYLSGVFFTSAANGYISGTNGTLLKYTLLEGAPEGADILGIQLPGQVGEAIVNKQQRTVTAEVMNTNDITKLVPEIFPSAGATIDPPSGTVQDFTNPVVYKITASDGTFKNWTVSVIGVDGVDEDWNMGNENDFRIFPNPAVDEFKVQSPKFKVGSVTIELYDLNGRILLEKTIPKGSEEVKIDVSHLQSGLYFCRISTEGYSVTKKLIIQK